MAPPDLATERYRLLIRQLGEERGSRRGWKAEVAKLLGVHPSYISKILATRGGSVGAEAVGRAIAALNLRSHWFYNEDLGATPHWKDSLQTNEVRTAVSAGVQAVQQWQAVSQEASALLAMLGRRPPPTADDVRGAMCGLILELERIPGFVDYKDACAAAIDGPGEAELIGAAQRLAIGVSALLQLVAPRLRERTVDLIHY